jgi:hypothetical protein
MYKNSLTEADPNMSQLPAKEEADAAIKNLIASKHQLNLVVADFMNTVGVILSGRLSSLNADSGEEPNTRKDRKGYVNSDDLKTFLGVDDNFIKSYEDWAKKLGMDEVVKDLGKKPSLMKNKGQRRALAANKDDANRSVNKNDNFL